MGYLDADLGVLSNDSKVNAVYPIGGVDVERESTTTVLCQHTTKTHAHVKLQQAALQESEA